MSHSNPTEAKMRKARKIRNHKIAARYQELDRSDPHVYKRTMAHLQSGALYVQDAEAHISNRS